MSKERSKQTAETQLSSDRTVSSQTLEELKQRYFQRYKYDPRLAELFDLIPAHKLRKYLTEKIEATPTGIDVMLYSQRLAEDGVQAVFDAWAQSQSLQGSELEHAQQELDDQILIHCDSLDALFDCIGTELECGYTFDIVDVNYRTLHPAVIWCMYAIVWAIRQYDKAKESKEQK